jgi:hypothetical protein
MTRLCLCRKQHSFILLRMAASDVQLATFQVAYARLKQTLKPHDAAQFNSTTLADVWKAARDIQHAQRQRQCLRNMGRLKPLLESLEKYAKTIEVVCNGTPYLPWIWVRFSVGFSEPSLTIIQAPIKLMLQVIPYQGKAGSKQINKRIACK